MKFEGTKNTSRASRFMRFEKASWQSIRKQKQTSACAMNMMDEHTYLSPHQQAAIIKHQHQ
jgi:hypothetical protein